jgi:tetratricopeptide (TPR) repeat protein
MSKASLTFNRYNVAMRRFGLLSALAIAATMRASPTEPAFACTYTQESRVTVQYVVMGPDSGDASLNEAKQLYLDGKLRGAELIYSRVLASDPVHADALRGRGLVELRTSRYTEAIRDLSAAEAQLGPYREEKFPGIVGSAGYLEWRKAQDVYEEGNEFLEKRDYQNAIKKFGEALHIYRRYPQCLHNLAIALGKLGQYNAAEMVCMEAISLRYSDWKFWKTLSIEFYMQNKFHNALAAIQEAIHLGPPETEQASLIEDIEIVKDQLRKRHGLFS